VTADDVFFIGGEYDANEDIGSIIQFGTSTTGGGVRDATFRNLLSKTELGSASGDFGCVVLKGTKADVHNCQFFDLVNSDTVTTNDSFPRAIVITGTNNVVSDVSITEAQCPVITTGNRNRITDIKAYGVADNGIYYGGQRNIIINFYIKDADDEPVVFTGDNNTVTNMVIDNTDTGVVMNAIGVQNAENCVIDGLTVLGKVKCANLIKARTGNTTSSLTVLNAHATVSSAFEVFNFGIGTTDFKLINSTIYVVLDTGYDYNQICDGGTQTFIGCHFDISEASGYTATQTYYYFLDEDFAESIDTSISFRASSGYARSTPFANSDGSKNLWNNSWDTAWMNQTYVERRKEYYNSAAPTGGTWNQGDIIWNTTPSAGGTLGWVCTTAGSPGTWKTFASIAS
jgi:hypothetical protein